MILQTGRNICYCFFDSFEDPGCHWDLEEDEENLSDEKG